MAAKFGGKTPFDLLEKRFVFIVSRIFFWILCGAASLALVAALVVLLVNLVPAAKQKVATPKAPAEVAVTLSDVERALSPEPEEVEPEEPGYRASPEARSDKSAKAKPATPRDTADPMLKAKIDTLKALFPADKYTWESVYGSRPARTDYWGRVTEWERYLVRRGIEYTLSRLLSLYSESPARVKVVEEATAIVAKFDVDRRGDAFQAYAETRREREMNRQQEISQMESEYAMKRASAEVKYASDKTKKASGAKDALRYAAAAFSGIALLGLFLCFLAIERNTRMLQEVLARNQGQ